MKSITDLLFIILIQVIVCSFWLLPFFLSISIFILSEKFEDKKNDNVIVSCLIDTIKSGKVNPLCDNEITKMISGNNTLSSLKDIDGMQSILNLKLKTDEMKLTLIKTLQNNVISIFTGIFSIFLKIGSGIYHFFSHLFTLFSSLFLFIKTIIKFIMMFFLYTTNLFDFGLKMIEKVWIALIAMAVPLLTNIFTFIFGAILMGIGITIKKLHGFMKKLHTPIEEKVNEMIRDI